MAAVAAPVRLERRLPPEEAARGDFYALLARLLFAGPDMALLQSLANAEPLPAEADPALAKAWHELALASSVMDDDAAAAEYEELFVGTGKSPLSIYAGFYLGAAAIDHPRVRLQAELASFRLARPDTVTEPEDHFSGLFEVMRVLVAGGAGRAPAPVAEQKCFFESYLEKGATDFFDAVKASDRANYYRKVAALGLAFIAIESESFALE
jgi:TorA maturation chaperone TorD